MSRLHEGHQRPSNSAPSTSGTQNMSIMQMRFHFHHPIAITQHKRQQLVSHSQLVQIAKRAATAVAVHIILLIKNLKQI
jgi:hypothetical protein